MKNDNRIRRKGHSQREVEDALAGLIASTRRVRRKLNLLEVAKKLKIAREAMGSLKKISDAIGLSPEMLRQFSRVERLSPETKKLVYKGAIQSVDIADRISRLPVRDQLTVAQAVACGELGDDDVRAVVSLRKELPKMPITEVINRVQASRNIKEYVVQFLVPSKEFKQKDLEMRFIRLLGKKNFLSLSVRNGVGTLIFNTAGKNRLQEVAKRRGLTKRRLIEGILVGGAK